jgi:hypothetical protein
MSLWWKKTFRSFGIVVGVLAAACLLSVGVGAFGAGRKTQGAILGAGVAILGALARRESKEGLAEGLRDGAAEVGAAIYADASQGNGGDCGSYGGDCGSYGN